jgi:hypothetical protein
LLNAGRFSEAKRWLVKSAAHGTPEIQTRVTEILARLSFN